MHKPFGGGTPTVTNIVLAASRASPATHIAIESKQRRAIPDILEAVLMQVAGLKLRGLEKSARIHFAFGTDAAGGCRGPTHIKPGELVAKGVQVKERIGG